jgi:streptomycin 6-kinase
VDVPTLLKETCARNPAATAWLEALPGVVAELERRWSLRLGSPFASAYSWVAPVERADGTPAVLKLGLPHFEAQHEIDGLRVWNGDGAVRLLESDRAHHALLLERLFPGSPLAERPRVEQDAVLAGLLLRLWQVPVPAQPFRSLAEMAERWCNEAVARRSSWADPGLTNEGLRLFEDLSRSASSSVLLATDLHAGNVLAAKREPWLVIDPKPFVGDPAYDATQHLLFDSRERLLGEDPDEAIRSFADLLELSHERVRLWTFARAALMSGTDPSRQWATDVARRLRDS